MSTPKPRNLTAEMQYKARGNPPATHPDLAVGNFFPGLEFNFQNVWKRFFIGLELLEYGGQVIAVDEAEVEASGGDTASPAPESVPLASLVSSVIVSIDDQLTYRVMQGPLQDENGGRPTILLEWSNMLAQIHAEKGGRPDKTVKCMFETGDGRRHGPYHLKVRRLIDDGTALISREASLPGEITESLCSPWQTDYIGCACYYWASNRPDYVNIDQPDGDTAGNNWLDVARLKADDGRPFYTLRDANVLQHEAVMQGWEDKFQFIIGGQDAPDGLVRPPSPDGQGS